MEIDTEDLRERFVPRQEKFLKYGGTFPNERYQLQRVYILATVLHNASKIGHVLPKFENCPRTQHALDWQADQETDLDEVEVYKSLKQMAATINFGPGISHNIGATTLVASAPCAHAESALSAQTERRPRPRFLRNSIRVSMLCSYSYSTRNGFNCGMTDPTIVFSDRKKDQLNSLLSPLQWAPKIVWPKGAERKPVLWHMQFDFVDLFTPIGQSSASCLGKRRRALNPFHQVSLPHEGEDYGDYRAWEAKRFKGVRWRDNRRTYVAEMRPLKAKNKVSFGDFHSLTEAVRAVDAAYHYFHKDDHINFPDSRELLTRISPEPPGLSAGDKLKFVKERAKWLASIAPTPPCAGSSLGFGSLLETLPQSVFNDNEERENAMVDPEPSWTTSSDQSSSSASVDFIGQRDCDRDQNSGESLMPSGMCIPWSPGENVFQIRSPSDQYFPDRDVMDFLLSEQQEEEHRPSR